MRKSEEVSLLVLIEKIKTLRGNLQALNDHYESKGIPKGRNFQKQNSQLMDSINRNLQLVKNYGTININTVTFKQSDIIRNIDLPLSSSNLYHYMEVFYPNSLIVKITSKLTGIPY